MIPSLLPSGGCCWCLSLQLSQCFCRQLLMFSLIYPFEVCYLVHQWFLSSSGDSKWLYLLLIVRRKYMPRRTTSVFRFAAVITAQCDARFNIPLYQCAFCSVTAHAHRKSIVRSNNALTGNFYVVYLFLFAVALLCWTTLVKSPSLICSHSALLTCADNIALPGFLYVYLMFLYTESSFLFIFHWFTRSNEH